MLKKKEFLNNLVHGSENAEDVMTKSQELGISLISRFYKVLISRIQSSSGNIQNQQEACSLLNSYSAAWQQAECFFHHSNLLVCIFKGSTRDELDESIFHAAEAIGHIATKNDDCTVLSAIGKTVEHLSQLQFSYEDAKHLLELGNEGGKNRIVSSDDIAEKTPLSNSALLELKENDPMVTRLKYAGRNDISAIIGESMDLVKKNEGQFSVFASYLLVDLMF